MKPRLIASLAAAAGLMAAVAAAGPAQAQAGALLVNTTAYLFPLQSHYCVGVAQPCSFNAAIEIAQRAGGGAMVSACFEAGNPRCLQESDPHYDVATGKWRLQVEDPFDAFVVSQDGMTIDFTLNIAGWSGPQDNKVAVEFNTEDTQVQGFLVEGSDNTFAGFEVLGDFEAGTFIVRADDPEEVSERNVFGPGMIFAGMDQGVGIRFRGAGVRENRVVGSWCGLTGDGTVVASVEEHCLEFTEGANNNFVGGPDAANRNVLAASAAAAVNLRHAATRDNTIQGNWIGTDVSGAKAAPNGTGISIVEEATGTKVLGNVISGNRVNAILADNTSMEFGRITTRIEDNWIGIGQDDKPLPNGTCGIEIRGLSKNLMIRNNRVWYNRLCGINISGAGARNNVITRNSVTQNAGRGINVASGANNGIQAPVIAVATRNTATGTACPGCTVEIFSDTIAEALFYEGTVTADATGAWAFQHPEGFALRVVTATATLDENTSSLSAPKVIPGVFNTPTPTSNTGGTPTPSGTPVQFLHNIWLPWTTNRLLVP